MRHVLDTNIVVYFLKGLLSDRLPDDEYGVSVISEIELLSYPSLPADDERLIRDLLATVEVINLSPDIRDAAIQLRRDHRLKVPDAIIAGTALALDAELLTNDARLAHVPGVRSRQLRMKNG